MWAFDYRASGVAVLAVVAMAGGAAAQEETVTVSLSAALYDVQGLGAD